MENGLGYAFSFEDSFNLNLSDLAGMKDFNRFAFRSAQFGFPYRPDEHGVSRRVSVANCGSKYAHTTIRGIGSDQ